jgi:hypothetical protein
MINSFSLFVVLGCFAHSADAPEKPAATGKLTLPGEQITGIELSAERLDEFMRLYAEERGAAAWKLGLQILADSVLVPEISADRFFGFLDAHFDPSGFTEGWLTDGEKVRRRLRYTNGGQMDLLVDRKRRLLYEIRISGLFLDPKIQWRERPLELATALGYFRNFMVRRGYSPNRIILSASYYGRGESVILESVFTEPTIQPTPPPTRFILLGRYWNPIIRQFSPNECLDAVLRDMPTVTDEQRRAAIQAYLHLTDSDAIILSSYRDIPTPRKWAPGHEVEPDLRRAVGPMKMFKRGSHPVEDVYVFYSWTKWDGVLKRHRIIFRPEQGAEIEEAVLATKAGAVAFRY